MISFNDFPKELGIDPSCTEAWIGLVLNCYNKRPGGLVFSFVSNERILEINRQYLKHDYPTDIITFDYCTRDVLSGEIYICPEVVLENSLRFDVSFRQEMKRVIVHGVLHLVGFSDGTDDEREEMRREEDYCLNLRV